MTSFLAMTTSRTPQLHFSISIFCGDVRPLTEEIRFSSFFFPKFLSGLSQIFKNIEKVWFSHQLFVKISWPGYGSGNKFLFFETYRRPGLWIWRFQDVLSLESCFSCGNSG